MVQRAMLCNQKRYCTGKPRYHNGFGVFSCPDFHVQTKRYFLCPEDLNYRLPLFQAVFERCILPKAAFFRFGRKIV